MNLRGSKIYKKWEKSRFYFSCSKQTKKNPEVEEKIAGVGHNCNTDPCTSKKDLSLERVTL